MAHIMLIYDYPILCPVWDVHHANAAQELKEFYVVSVLYSLLKNRLLRRTESSKG